MKSILLSLAVAAVVTFASIGSANAQAPGWGYSNNYGDYGGYQAQVRPQFQSSYQPQYRAHSRNSGHYDYQPSSVQQHRGHYDYVSPHYDYHRNRHSH